MPHAANMPSPGLQALILCGPGASLSTFTANPEEFPKAVIPIANRPMIWYALDYCYRMGVTDIFVITPPVSQKVIEDTMNTNQYLTALPTPRPDVIAPVGLTYESGTADILRLPEIQKAITSDFVVLPCDIVSELPGESLLEVWMMQQDYLEDISRSPPLEGKPDLQSLRNYTRHKGGLGIWYPIKDSHTFKNEETDLLITSPLAMPTVPPIDTSSSLAANSVRKHLELLMSAMPTDTMKDVMEAQTGQEKFLALRPGLLRAGDRVKLRTAYRDAHIYIFPYWIMNFAKQVSEFDSMSEDIVGSWAKATWQPGFADKLKLGNILDKHRGHEARDEHSPREGRREDNVEVDVMQMTSTKVTNLEGQLKDLSKCNGKPKLHVPPFISYIHPLPPAANFAAAAASQPSSSTTTSQTFPLIRRVDTAPMLLSISLRLAKLDSIDEVGARAASNLAHQAKIAYPAGIATRSTVSKSDSLLDVNVTVEERCVVKECVIGANCVIKQGARLTRCLLMEGVIVGEKCQLTDCIVGRRARLGKDCVLRECRVQEGNAIPDETEAKGEDIMVFEGLDDEADFEGEDGIETED